MPVPQDLQNYLTEIQKYLELQQNELQKEYKKQKGELPEQDPFEELTQAIHCVKNLKKIQGKILEYWDDLE
ncbi:MAG: hypothetical protein F6J98_07025 [Moorea sp. SIO4G2]|uniref:Uncharacterized protein n=1 Tax=Moorena bouillonii PNG TaxID=568701 RepID=A0A1U7N834_9CYAN|nr:hypothetical protein [Moorena bouillonii]NEO44195.1 hypothetical protein [Moorena sp. SIO4A3]NEO60191.1 hypothetical protein [Moorena sp. SIO4G2]OLT62103.1 hypothetical protein BJP37_26880 [Moorena bouillonii PNG]